MGHTFYDHLHNLQAVCSTAFKMVAWSWNLQNAPFSDDSLVPWPHNFGRRGCCRPSKDREGRVLACTNIQHSTCTRGSAVSWICQLLSAFSPCLRTGCQTSLLTDGMHKGFPLDNRLTEYIRGTVTLSPNCSCIDPSWLHPDIYPRHQCKQHWYRSSTIINERRIPIKKCKSK